MSRPSCPSSMVRVTHHMPHVYMPQLPTMPTCPLPSDFRGPLSAGHPPRPPQEIARSNSGGAQKKEKKRSAIHLVRLGSDGQENNKRTPHCRCSAECGSRTSTSTGTQTLTSQPPTHPTHPACGGTKETLGPLGLQFARASFPPGTSAARLEKHKQ
eukprot:scaffold5533_cov129-Isochrysis_galbana.AAC.4